MKSFDVGYRAGYFLGMIVVYGLYAIGIIAFIFDVIHLTLPILPLTYMFVLGIWRKLMQIEVGLNLHGTINDRINKLNDLMAAQKPTNQPKGNKFGGLN